MTFPEMFLAIEERRELMVTAINKVVAATQDFDKLDDEIFDLAKLHHHFEQPEFDKESADMLRTLEDIARFTNELAIDLVHEGKRRRDHFHEFMHEFEHLVDYIIETHAQIQLKFFDTEDYIHKYEEVLDDCHFKLMLTFTEVLEHMAEISHQIQMLRLDTVAGLEEFNLALTGGITTQLEQTFVSLRTTVDNVAQRELPASSRKFLDRLHSTFDQLNQIATDQAALLGDTMQVMMLELDDLLQRDAMSVLQSTFAKSIEAIDSMAATLKQTEATLAGGAHIASAISHWLPALRNIKEMVETVQAAASGE